MMQEIKDKHDEGGVFFSPAHDTPMPPPTKKKGCFFIYGCSCGCFALILLLGGPAPLLPFFFPALFTTSGEHLPIAESYSPEATDYSFHNTFMHQVCEFNISEQAFLEMCRERKWPPIAVESLPELPPFDWQSPRPWINYEREVPQTVPRYIYPKPGHEHCDPWNFDTCGIDPTGKTDESCFRSVTRGYYYEYRVDNGGGTVMLYDSENGRCYIHSNHH